MLAAGALEEVAALAARKLDPLLPAMKAHGVPALIRHLKGEITREEAAEIGRADTRHYAKRQFTWFRHQLPEFEWVAPEAARGWVEACRIAAIRAVSLRSPSAEPLHGREQQIRTRRTAGTPLNCSKSRFERPSLDFRGSGGITAQPLGSLSRQMRNIITKLLIVVVPRRTAGDG